MHRSHSYFLYEIFYKSFEIHLNNKKSLKKNVLMIIKVESKYVKYGLIFDILFSMSNN